MLDSIMISNFFGYSAKQNKERKERTKTNL